MAKYQELADAIIRGDNTSSRVIAEKLVADGVAATEILNDGLVPGMNVVGTKFKANEMYIPEVLIAARAMHAAMDIIKPLLAEGKAVMKGTVVVGTVQGDLHDIGKNLVCMMLEGGGFSTMPGMKDVIEALKADPATAGVKVMVGGAPLTQEYADSIGAAGYAADASSAVDLAGALV